MAAGSPNCAAKLWDDDDDDGESRYLLPYGPAQIIRKKHSYCVAGGHAWRDALASIPPGMHKSHLRGCKDIRTVTSAILFSDFLQTVGCIPVHLEQGRT